MDEKKPIQKIYDFVSSSYDIGDYNTFQEKMKSPESRKKFFDMASQHFDLGDFQTFESKVGGVQPQPTPQTQPKPDNFQQRTGLLSKAYLDNAKQLAQDFMESGFVHGVTESVKGIPSALDRIILNTSPVAPQILQKSGVDVSMKPVTEALGERAKAVGNLPAALTGNEPFFDKSQFVRTVEEKLANRQPLTEEEKAYLGSGLIADIAGSSVAGTTAIKAIGATTKLGTALSATGGGAVYDFATTNEGVGTRAVTAGLGATIGLLTSIPTIIKTIKANKPDLSIKDATELAKEIKASNPDGIAETDLIDYLNIPDENYAVYDFAKYKGMDETELADYAKSKGIELKGNTRDDKIVEIEKARLATENFGLDTPKKEIPLKLSEIPDSGLIVMKDGKPVRIVVDQDTGERILINSDGTEQILGGASSDTYISKFGITHYDVQPRSGNKTIEQFKNNPQTPSPRKKAQTKKDIENEATISQLENEKSKSAKTLRTLSYIQKAIDDYTGNLNGEYSFAKARKIFLEENGDIRKIADRLQKEYPTNIGLLTSIPTIVKSIKASKPDLSIKEATDLAKEIKASNPDGIAETDLTEIANYSNLKGIELKDEVKGLGRVDLINKIRQAEKPIETPTQEVKSESSSLKDVESTAKALEDKVYYHGTPNKEFNGEFDDAKIGERDSGFIGRGFYFTEDKNIADQYQYKGGKKGKILERRLDVKNPLRLDKEHINPQELSEDVFKYIDEERQKRGKEPYRQENRKGDIVELTKKLTEAKHGTIVGRDLKEWVDLTDYAKSRGYDAIIGSKEIVVFDKSQIKSVEDLLSNKEVSNATQKGQVQENNISEYPQGNESRKATETGGGEMVDNRTKQQLLDERLNKIQEIKRKAEGTHEEGAKRYNELVNELGDENAAIRKLVEEINARAKKEIDKLPELPKTENEVINEKGESDFVKIKNDLGFKTTDYKWGNSPMDEDIGDILLSKDKESAIFIKPNEVEVYDEINDQTDTVTNGIKIELVSTKEEARGKGKAKELIQKVVNWADKNGTDLYLDIAPQDKLTTESRLKKLYESFGFEFNGIHGKRKPQGNQVGQTAETSGGNRPIEGGKVQEEKTVAPEMKTSKAFTTLEEKQLAPPEFLAEFKARNLHLYETRNQEFVKAQAKAVVDKYGIEESARLSTDITAGLEPDTMIGVRWELNKKFNEMVSDAKKAGDNVAYQEALDKQLDYVKKSNGILGTLGQGVSMAKAYDQLLPDQYLNIYKKAIQAHNQDVDKTFAEMFKKALDKLKSKSGVKPKPIPTESEKLAKGIIDNAKKIQPSEEVQKKIVEMYNDIASAKGDIAQQTASGKLLTYIADQVPLSKSDMVLGYLYPAVLASVKTQAVNAISTGLNTALKSLILTVTNPLGAKEIGKGAIRGLEQALYDAYKVLKTGQVTGTRSYNMEMGKPIERMAKNASKFNLLIHSLKLSSRLMSASDVFWFKTFEEMQSTALAHQIARKEKLSGKALSTKVNEILGNTKEALDNAKKMAVDEGYAIGSVDYKRRVNEIVTSQRSEYIKARAKGESLEATFNQKPDGVMGKFASALNNLVKEIPPLRLVVPFTNIVANVNNRAIELSPLGYIRTLLKWKNGSYAKLPGKLQEDIATNTVGGLTLITAGMMLGDKVHGSGTGNGDRDNQLREAGWMPNSLVLNGKYYSYQGTPLEIPLSLVGNYYDAIRYKKLDQQDAQNRVAYALTMTPNVLLDKSFTSGLTRLISSLERNPNPNTDFMTKFAVYSSSIPKLAIPAYTREITRLFDNKIYSAGDIKGALAMGTPIAGWFNRPKINIFGEEVERGSRFISEMSDDKIFKLLSSKNTFVSVPNKERVFVDKHGNVRDMSPIEYYDFIKYRGKYLKQSMNKYYKNLSEMNTDDFNNALGSLQSESEMYANEKINNFK